MTKSFLPTTSLSHKSSDTSCRKGLFSIYFGAMSTNTTSLGPNYHIMYHRQVCVSIESLKDDDFPHFAIYLLVVIYLLTHNMELFPGVSDYKNL